jgi:hypothetical protein
MWVNRYLVELLNWTLAEVNPSVQRRELTLAIQIVQVLGERLAISVLWL